MNRRGSIALVAFVTSLPAIAEVFDKVPSVGQLWLQGGVMAVLLFAIGRLRLWTAALAAVLAGFFAMGAYDMLSDEHLGLAARAELGMSYVASAYGSAALCVIAAVAAAVSAVRARRGRADTA